MQTTDPQDELFDVLHPDGSPAGYSKPRGAIHRDGDWHRSLHIWVYRVIDGGVEVLFQRRSLTKDTWPDSLDVTVGGHLRAGETIAETVREAAEEIGVELQLEDLVRIGRRFAAHRNERWYDREVNEVFAAHVDLPLTEFRLHPEEVDGLVAIALDAARALYADAERHVVAYEARRGEDGWPLPPVQISLTQRDFVEIDDDYARVTLAVLAKLVAGEAFDEFLIEAPNL